MSNLQKFPISTSAQVINNEIFNGQGFNTTQALPTGASNATITATDANNVQTINNIQFNLQCDNTANLTFDLNGNSTYDGNNNYQYDAQDRLVMITYAGTGNNTQFFYDGLNHWVKSIETTNNATTSTIQYLWSGDRLIEERDQNSNVLRRFFDGGEQINSANYYYVKDHLGSIRQMTNSSGAIVYQADYDAYGNSTVFVNSATPSFGYAGYFSHARSGLNLTVHRAYSANLARFINRDPIAESGGINLYGYVGADPLGEVDPSGTANVKGLIFKYNCDQLLQKIYDAIKQLEKREKDIQNNNFRKCPLPDNGTKGTVESHKKQFAQSQQNLKNLIDAYNNSGCNGPLPPDATKWANRPIPEPLPLQDPFSPLERVIKNVDDILKNIPHIPIFPLPVPVPLVPIFVVP